MLPCKQGCPHYCDGCHKRCKVFAAIVQADQEIRAKIKAARRKAVDEVGFLQAVMAPITKINAQNKKRAHRRGNVR